MTGKKRTKMILNDFNYLNKILSLKDMGFNIIENVEFEILDDSDISDSNSDNVNKYVRNNDLQF